MKKIILFFLLISLVYCPAALAGDGEEYSQNAQILLSQLGLLGKLTAPEAPTVSRADFLYTLMSALKIDVDAPAPQSAFSDLDQGHFVNAAASAALQMGIASPNERFRPDDPILYAEALKLCVGAAGYEVRAIAGGGYPAGHLSVAGSIGLSRQVSAGLYNTLSGAQCITLLYNTLCADRMRQTGFGENFEFSVTRGETILSELYQLYKINGIVDATPVTGLNLEGKGAGDGRLMVDGILYHYENEDAENLLGMRVAAFYRKADSEPYDILALAPEKNETIIIQPEKVTEASDQSIRCQEEDKSQTYRLSKDYDMVFNGKAVKLEADVTLLRDAGKIRLLDHDGDGSYDLIFIEKIQYLYISGINTAKQIIYDKNSADRMLDLSEPDCRYTLTDQKSGQKVELESLQQGKLLGHLTSADGQYSRIFLFSDLVSGTVTAARPEEKLICVGEAWYRLSDYYLRYYGIPDLGANATFLLGLEEEIAALSTANTAMSYGFLVKARAGGGMLQPPEVKLFTQSGAMLVASLADHVLLDGNRLGAAAVLEKLTDGEKTKSQLIRFLQNGEDEIIKIDTKEPGDPTHRPENSFVPKDAGDNDKLFLHRFGTEKADAAGENPTWSDLPTEAYTYRYKSGGFFYPKFNLSGALVFVIPQDEEAREDDKQYSMGGSGSFTNDKNYTDLELMVYNIGQTGSAEAVVLFDKTGAAKAPDDNCNSAVISKVNLVYDEEIGAARPSVEVLSNNRFSTYTLSEDVTVVKDSGSNTLCPGDIIRFYAEGERITALTVDFDAAPEVFKGASNIPFNGDSQIVQYQSGLLYACAGGFAYLSNGSFADQRFDTSWAAQRNTPMHTGSLAIITFRRTSSGSLEFQSLRPAVPEDLRPYVSVGEGADFVVIRQRYLEARATFAYRILEA